MPGGGELRLSTMELAQKAVRTRHAEATASSYVCIEVSDTGAGMDEPTQARIFEPFFTTKARGVGSGMGLAVVYGVVTSHRGFVDVESRPGEGTRLRLYVPVLAGLPQPRSARPLRPERPRGGSETILLVEDESELLDAMCELLEQEGYTVLTARTGTEALKVYRERGSEIALLVTDLELPEMSGWDAFQKIRELAPDVKAVLVSGYLDAPMRTRMLEGGAKGFLRKPYTIEEILSTMRDVLDERSEPAERPKGGKPKKKK
jgi:CheY-like chemotaxis protein